MSERIMKALANCDQGLTEEQKLRTRTNIGAIGGVKVADGSGTTPLVPDANGYVTVDLTEAGKVQSDWDETNPAEPSYILNKPDIPEMQVQSDWTEQDTSSKAYIQNKPTLATVATSGSYDDLSDKPDIPAAQVQSDWNEGNSAAVDYIKNKPTLAAVATSGSYNDLSDKPSLPSAQVQSDWSQTNTSAVDYIRNKPSLSAVATSGSYDDLSNKPSIPAAQVQSNWTQTNSGAVDYIKNKPALAAVATSGDYADLQNKPSIPAAQVQSDWNEGNSAAVDYIKNKPSLSTVATSGSYNDLQDKPSIPAAQVQSDWAQTNTSAADYIRNKPAAMETKPLVAGTNISFSSTASETAINSTATKVVSRSAPYTTEVDITELTVYDPGEDHGSLLQVLGGTTIGMLVPKHYGASDLGKVLTVVSDNGYKTEWKPAPGDLKPLTTVTSTLNTVSQVVLDVVDGNAYSLELGDSVSAYVSLSTSSTSTVHTLVYVKNPSGSLCGSVTLAWRDAALNQHTAEILLTDSAYTYCFDVYVRKVTVGASDYAIASVCDYPVAYRKGLVSFSTANETTQMVGVWRT